MKYSKGIMWLSDCRIPFVDEGDTTINHNTQPGSFVGSFGSSETIYKENTKGRFTPNLLVCDDMLNDGIKPNKGHRAKTKVTGYGEFGGGKSEYHGIGEYMEVDSKSRYYDLDKWFDKVIDEIQ
jgi:hypothetical protein